MDKKMRTIVGLIAMALLFVVAGCAGTESARSTGAYLDDNVISTKVKSQLAADPVTKATQVQVETYQGVVQLSGFVSSKAAIDRATEIARSVEGVKKVENNLALRSEVTPRR